MGLTGDWNAVERLDDEMLVNAIAQVGRSMAAPSRPCLKRKRCPAAPSC
jgi:hypothetical protein